MYAITAINADGEDYAVATTDSELFGKTICRAIYQRFGKGARPWFQDVHMTDTTGLETYSAVRS